MIHDIFLVSTGGVLLFSKEFKTNKNKSSGNAQMLSALLTAMVTFSTQKTGFPVSFIEFSTLSLSLLTNAEFGITCALFTDIEDGSEFTSLLCREILLSFVNTYNTELLDGSASVSKQIFQSFNVQISEIIKGSVKPVLESLHNVRGVTSCALITNNIVFHSTSEVDKVGLLANHQVLLRSGGSLLGLTDDVACHFRMQGGKTTLDMYKIESAYLIVKYKNAVNPSLIQDEIRTRTKLIAQILLLTSNLQGDLD